MSHTYNASALQEVAVNSQDSTTGEIRTSDISDESDWSVDIPDAETTPEDEPFFVVSKMTGELVIEDYDFGFVDTMNSGDTLEDRMVANQTVFVQLVLEGGTLQDSAASTWFEVKPMVPPIGDVSDNEGLLKPRLDFTHSDYGGVQRI